MGRRDLPGRLQVLPCEPVVAVRPSDTLPQLLCACFCASASALSSQKVGFCRVKAPVFHMQLSVDACFRAERLIQRKLSSLSRSIAACRQCDTHTLDG